MHIINGLCNSMLHNMTLMSEWGGRVWMSGSAYKNLGGRASPLPRKINIFNWVAIHKGVELYVHRELHLTSRTFKPSNQETHIQERILHNTTVTLKSNRPPQYLKCQTWLQWKSFANRHVAQNDTNFLNEVDVFEYVPFTEESDHTSTVNCT